MLSMNNAQMLYRNTTFSLKFKIVSTSGVLNTTVIDKKILHLRKLLILIFVRNAVFFKVFSTSGLIV